MLRAAEKPHIRLQFEYEKQVRTVEGRQLVQAKDGGILLLGRDGRLWNVTPDLIQEKTVLESEFEPLSAEELGKQLERELGAGFESFTTRHYVICTDAGRHYAQWCGRLFERLMAGFEKHWRADRIELSDPEFPLAAIVFADQKDFAKFATEDVGPGFADSKGYYSIVSNRMVLFDLSAMPGSRPATSEAEINRRVARNPYNIATVVHEATHQIAFNTGIHVRYGSNPLWVTEGLAMYFETPDLRNKSGWKTMGRVNPLRMGRFRKIVSERSPDSLKTLIASDERLTQAETFVDAYSEAWALTYFLIKTRRKEYVAYLAKLQKKPRLIWDDAETRIADFEEAFGDDWEDLERDFLRFMARQR